MKARVKGDQLLSFSISNNKSLPNQAILKGSGLLPTLNAISLDWKERHIQSKHDTIARIINTGNDKAIVQLDSTTGLNSIFDYTFPGGITTLQLGPNQSTDIICSFKPDDTILYEHKGNVYYTNGFVRDSVILDLYGKGVVPIIKQQDIHVGTIREKDAKDTSGILFTTAGTMPLTIEKFSVIAGDTSSFIIDTVSIIDDE